MSKIKLWTQQHFWKQRKREPQYHSHPSDNSFENEDEEEANVDGSFARGNFRRQRRVSVMIVPNQDEKSPVANRPHMIESDDDENRGSFHRVDVDHLVPPRKFNALHHRHYTNEDKFQLPQSTLKRMNHKREGRFYTRGAFSPARRGSSIRNKFCNHTTKGNGWIRNSFLLGIATSVTIMIIQSQILHQWEEPPDIYSQSVMFIPGDPTENWSNNRGLFLSSRERARMAREIAARNTERKRRTTPPETSTTLSIDLYDVHSLEDEEEPINRFVRSEAQRPANLGELCGLHAQKSSLANPYSYLTRDALTTNSRVLITGILSPIGFHLALALKERCGVESIIGIDPMFPNTVKNRLDLQEQIKILNTNIPQLAQPIILPLIGLDPRIKKRDSLTSVTLLNSTGELNLLSSQPTHIVHLDLASMYASDMYTTRGGNKEWRNTFSPYVTDDHNPAMYQLQSSASAMEQILASMVSADISERPHFTYNSITRLQTDGSSSKDSFYAYSKQRDDILVDTYHSLSGTFAVGLRLPNAIYGPWARACNVVHDVVESLVVNRNSTESDMDITNSSKQLDLLYVDDVVDAIIAAMQFRPESSSPVLIDLASESTTTLSSLQNVVRSLATKSQNASASSPPPEVAPLPVQQFIQWKPRTSLRDGLLKTIAWHLDRKYPFGKSSTDPADSLTGDEFLSLHGAPTCSADDIVCHSGYKYLPCISECASKSHCTPSIFDDVVEIVRDVSAGCDIVMYTQSFGSEVNDINLHVQYIDDSSPQICNLAFVPRNSKLVDSVVLKVPDSQLVKFGVANEPGDTGITQERKLDGLNGNLLYRGWILVWLQNATLPLLPSDEALLKIAPGRLFSKDVKSAVYVDPNFSVSPTVDDIAFLFDELYRSPLKQRSAYLSVTNGKVKKKSKYILAAEPARKAALLFAKLKIPQDPAGTMSRDSKISLFEAIRCMRVEMGMDLDVKESSELQHQRQFYERVIAFVNHHDLRSPLEPLYYYEMKHWIRSRWVVHDLRLEESRQLRCRWYQEHTQWGGDLDQLSFAYIMANTELERKMAHHEPDYHIKPAFVEHPELLDLTDAYEWHALNTEHSEVLNLVVKKIPDHLVDKEPKDDGDEMDLEAPPVSEISGVNNDAIPSVRIMSDKVMALSRSIWMQTRRQRARPKR